jgi:hypothetical protein
MLQVCLSRCYICFTDMLQVFYLDVAYVWNGFKCFSCVFSSISYACFKCFICLQTYVVIVASGYFKSRSGVAHVAMRVRNGGGMSGLRKWTGGADPHGHAKRRRGAWCASARAKTKCNVGIRMWMSVHTSGR